MTLGRTGLPISLALLAMAGFAIVRLSNPLASAWTRRAKLSIREWTPRVRPKPRAASLAATASRSSGS